MSYQSIFPPVYCLVLIGIRVRETFDLTRFASEKTVEVGSDFVSLALAQRMALRTSRLQDGQTRSR